MDHGPLDGGPYFGGANRSSKFVSGCDWAGTDVRVAVKPMTRPAAITPTQIRIDTVATTFASGGVFGDRSHCASVFRAVSSNTSMLTAASTSSSIFTRKNVL